MVLISSVLRSSLLAACLLIAHCVAPAADRTPVVPAGASNRFELALDPKTQIKGLSAQQTAQFRRRIDDVVAYLRRLESVSHPPAPTCVRLHTWLDTEAAAGIARASVDASIPIGFEGQRCHAITGSGVGIQINDFSAAFGQDRTVQAADGKQYLLLDIESQQEGVTRLRDKTIILSRPGRLPWRPVKRQKYLEQEARRLADELAAAEKAAKEFNAYYARSGGTMPTDEQDMLAGSLRLQKASLERVRRALADSRLGNGSTALCLDATGQVSDGECLADMVLMEPDPNYWNRGTPEHIQLIVVRTPEAQHTMEDDQRFTVRMRIYESIDLGRLRELIDK